MLHSQALQPWVSASRGVTALVSYYFWERWLDKQSYTRGYLSLPREGARAGKSRPLSLEATQSCSQVLLFPQDALGARGAARWQAHSQLPFLPGIPSPLLLHSGCAKALPCKAALWTVRSCITIFQSYMQVWSQPNSNGNCTSLALELNLDELPEHATARSETPSPVCAQASMG